MLIPADAVSLAVGAEVTLALTGTSVDGLRWVVRATGTALLAVGPSSSTLAAARRRHPAYSARRCPDDVLRLPITGVRGFYETASETGERVQPDGDSELTAGG